MMKCLSKEVAYNLFLYFSNPSKKLKKKSKNFAAIDQ